MYLKTAENFLNLKGKIALVTGAAGNLGREICKALSEVGVDLILVDHQDSDLSELEDYIKQSTKVKVYKHYCDLDNES